jgi:hypothetical protein
MNTRKYKKTEITKRGNIVSSLRKGLKKVNIGDDVWIIGRLNYINNKPHCVIYGPDRKEYHLWDYGADNIQKSYCSRNGCMANEAEVKIHILTSILDDVNNWEFNLKKIPSVGRLKVILENGTVKNIDFNGVFNQQELISERFTSVYRKTMWGEEYASTSRYFKNIVGYRKN